MEMYSGFPKLDLLIKKQLPADWNHTRRINLVAVDPGETTGITHMAWFGRESMIRRQKQFNSWPIEEFVRDFTDWLDCSHHPDYENWVVFEAYHVYRWRLDEHTFSQVPTIQLIGALKTICIQKGWKYWEQTAQVGKGFFKDEMLQKLDMYIPGQKHARDSLRHAAHFMLFQMKNL